MSFNTISVIGLGYIGLPTAAMFASKDKKVIGVDVSQHVVDTVNAGKIHIVEPELDLMVKNAVGGAFLKAKTVPEPADAFIIAVPTPFLAVKDQYLIPEPDLSYIKSASISVAKVLKKGNLVILESTSPVGTTEQMSAWLAEERSDLTFPQTHGEESDIRIAHCPERVLPGQVIKELVENDRVIGGMTNKCSRASIELYKTFVKGDFFVTNAKTAEMAKLTENSCRDVQIAFANELSIICDNFGIDIWELINLANRHPRINILKPGPGVGGHCIAVDPWFIVGSADGEAKLIKTARERNLYKQKWTILKIKTAIEKWKAKNLSIDSGRSIQKINDGDQNESPKCSSSPRIALFGLTFKPNIDDLRESPALEIAKQLTSEFSNVICVEPNLSAEVISLETLTSVSIDQALKESDIIIFLVAHNSFKKICIDGLNVLDFCGATK